MTQELSKLELVKLFNAEAPRNAERLEKINAELQVRLKEVDSISETIVSGGVRSLEQLDSLLKDLENHRARTIELKREADLMMVDMTMDLDAINKLPR